MGATTTAEAPGLAGADARRRRALARRRAKRAIEGLVYRCVAPLATPVCPPRRAALPPRRVLLLLRGQRLGDAVVALPFSAAVRRAYPRAELRAAGSPALGEVLARDASLDGFVPLPFPEWRHPWAFARAWRALGRDFDLAFVLGIQFLSTAAARASARHVVGYDYNHRGFLLDRALAPHVSCNRSGWEYGPETDPPHITRFWGGLLESVTGEAVPVSWSALALTTEDHASAAAFLAAGNAAARPLVVLHPFASSAMRTWPMGLAAGFLDQALATTDWRVVVTGGAADRPRAAALAAGRSRVSVAAGALDLGASWALLARAAVVVSVDTAVIHMAAAVGRPVVSLFGPGDPLVWGPYGQEAGVVQAHPECQRCKGARCVHPGLPCMNALTPALVLERTRRALA